MCSPALYLPVYSHALCTDACIHCMHYTSMHAHACGACLRVTMHTWASAVRRGSRAKTRPAQAKKPSGYLRRRPRNKSKDKRRNYAHIHCDWRRSEQVRPSNNALEYFFWLFSVRGNYLLYVRRVIRPSMLCIGKVESKR